MTLDEYRSMHGCSACKNAGTNETGNDIMPALTIAQNDERRQKGMWGYCVQLGKTIDSSDGKDCLNFRPDHDIF